MKNTMLEMSRYEALARQAVAEGVVLLKNEAVLPLASGGRAALFGYAQFHYYKSGTGSGGLVNTAHLPNNMQMPRYQFDICTTPRLELRRDGTGRPPVDPAPGVRQPRPFPPPVQPGGGAFNPWC